MPAFSPRSIRTGGFAALLVSALLCACGSDSTTMSPDLGADLAAGPDLAPLYWPNAQSSANSDPWIAEHHAEIRQMRPRVLALQFVNGRTMDAARAQLNEEVAVIAEASRYHGYEDPAAPPFLAYDLAYLIDLRDATPPEMVIPSGPPAGRAGPSGSG